VAKEKAKKRRPKKIEHPKQPDVDDDLRELALVLNENRLDANALGWFTIPWRDGWNAIEMAQRCFERNFDEYASSRENNIDKFITDILSAKSSNAEAYWVAGEYLTRIDTDDISPFLVAAVRCLQVQISNSSGGGAVFNYILKHAFDKTEPSELLAEVVLEYRCRDAIGTTAVMQSDSSNKRRRAFIIAWERGLFHAAYAIGRSRE
jgi:hypothetical protein